MESPTELFIKEIFRWLLHLSAFEPPNENPSKQVYVISTASFPETTPGDTWTQSLITNFLNVNLPRVKPPQAKFTDHHKQDFSLLALTSNCEFTINIMGYRTLRLTHLLGRQDKHARWQAGTHESWLVSEMSPLCSGI